MIQADAIILGIYGILVLPYYFVMETVIILSCLFPYEHISDGDGDGGGGGGVSQQYTKETTVHYTANGTYSGTSVRYV